MLLIEIRDPSDYQRGDESNPRSPHFEDEPDWDSMADDHMPTLPILQAQAKPGRTPGGNTYNLVITITVPKGDNTAAEIEEYTWSDFDAATDGQWEYVDDSSTTQGGNTVTTIFGQSSSPDIKIETWSKIYAELARRVGQKYGAAAARKSGMAPQDDY